MTAPALWLMAVAVLLLALGILLWQNAKSRLHQNATSDFVNQQIRSMAPTLDADADGSDQPLFLPAQPGPRLWRHFWLRAGVVPGIALYAGLLLPGLVLAILAMVFGGVLSTVCAVLMYLVLAYFRLWLKITRRHQKMVHQLPAFLDTMVRLTTIGNSLESSFQATLLTIDAPLKEPLNRANLLIQAGRSLEHALAQEARTFRLTELNLVAAVIGVALRFGGRADTVLERMASFMRDREQAQSELLALSAEIRLSAWVLALMPIGLGAFMVMFNNDMFMLMWDDSVGKQLLFGATVMEFVGAYWLYRLAKSV
ncbi:type II secretion system F family protein [Herbaspirillum chlorophenolicum]|uniref:Type II secretion system F family protein n=1 Tax=Herbaspirillum chlorophenolicum TaxID=211589 RepID=A0ABW8EY34_9BURK